MTSTLKVQNIQYTDGDAALTIADGGIVTGHNTLNVSHGTHAANVGTFINTTHNSNINGVVHVKQSAGTNQPTMVIEQDGGGGNSGDTQGLHIKIDGQNQGTGKAIRVTTENSSLNSGTAYDPFTVTNGGNITVKNTSNATTLSLNQSGYLTLPKQPLYSGVRSATRMNTANGYTMTNVNLIPWSDVLNQGSHFASNIFTAPAAGNYLCSVYGLVYSATTTWIAIYIYHNASTKTVAYKGVSTSWDNIGSSIILPVSANDTIKFQVEAGHADAQLHEGQFGGAAIQLIG